LNDAGTQQSRNLIPANTLPAVSLSIEPGGAGSDGWLTSAKDGRSRHLNCTLTVLGGDFNKRKIWSRLTVEGDSPGHKEAVGISMRIVRAMLEAARNVRPDDTSDTAKLARQINSWADLDQLRFQIRVDVEPPRNGYAAKNTIGEVIVPGHASYKKLDQVDRATIAHPAPTPSQPTDTSAPAPAGAIVKPKWAS
jgi:hypothetical protein